MNSSKTIELIERKVKRIGIADDQPEYWEQSSRKLREEGFEVVISESLEEAEELLKGSRFTVWFFDNIFRNPRQETGSSFINDHGELLNEVETVLVTAWPPSHVFGRADLVRKGVKILDHAPNDCEEEILEISRNASNRRCKEFYQKVERYCEALVGNVRDEKELDSLPPDPNLITRAKSHLISYISTLPDQDTQLLLYGQRTMTATELKREVENNSEVGKHMVELLLKHLFRGLQ